MLPRSLSLVPLLLCALSPSAQAAPADAPATNTRIATLLQTLGQVHHVGDVSLSPDGSTIAMMLGGSLTVAPLGGNPAQARTPQVCARSSIKPAISSVSWSPDSAHLAVLATCGEDQGVYLLDRSGSANAHPLAPLHGFAKSLEYAPDGKHLGVLYVEGATRPSGALAAMKPPSGVIGVEGLEIQRIATIDTSSGALAQLTPAGLHVYEYSWSPDSQQLTYIAALPPGENNWWVAKLYTQPATGTSATSQAEAHAILDPATVEGSLHGLQIAVPRFSPDGSHIAFIGGLMSDQGATGGDLYLVPASGHGAPVNFTANAPTTVEWFTWTPAQHILATEIAAGKAQLDELSFTFPPGFKAPGGTRVLTTNRLTSRTIITWPHVVGDGRLSGSLSFSRDFSRVAYQASSYDRAPEIYAGPVAEPLQITHLNAGLKPAWGKSESIEWSNDGFHVQGWLLYPANYDPSKKYPMIIMAHGGPSSAVLPRWPGTGFGAAPFSAMGYFVLEPNPRGSFGQGEAFTAANRKDFGYGDLRDILAGIDAVEKKLPIDDKRLGITGWSYGGFMTMFSVTQTQRFHAAVAGAGLSNWQSYYGENSIDQWMTPFFGASVYDDPAIYAKSSAINYIKQVKTPTLVVVGDRDGECPAPQSFEFWHALKAQGIETQLVVYPNEGHGFTLPEHQKDVLVRAIGWFDQHLQ